MSFDQVTNMPSHVEDSHPTSDLQADRAFSTLQGAGEGLEPW